MSAPVKLRRPRSNPDLKIIEDTGFLRMEAGLGSPRVITVRDNNNNDSDQAGTGDVGGMLIMRLT